MKIVITGRGFSPSDAIEAYAHRKVGKLDRFFGDDVEASVRLSTLRGRSTVEMTIPIRGDVLRAEETAGDMYAAIDGAMAKVERQLHKYRSRFDKRTREGVQLAEEYPEVIEPIHTIVRTKRFALEPISVEEAATQMEMLGHSFFVFEDEDTLNTCVIYQRDDGTLGLLIPEKA